MMAAHLLRQLDGNVRGEVEQHEELGHGDAPLENALALPHHHEQPHLRRRHDGLARRDAPVPLRRVRRHGVLRDDGADRRRVQVGICTTARLIERQPNLGSI